VTASRHRRLIVLRGTPEDTLAEARRLVAHLRPADVLWVGDDKRAVPRWEVRGLLGRSFDAVIVDQHDTTDADVMGQCHGFVWGGGVMILRRSHTTAQTRFERRLERVLAKHAPDASKEPVTPPDHGVTATADQDRVVARLTHLLTLGTPQLVALVADRGRGKSAALGRALAVVARTAPAGRAPRVAVTAASDSAALEVFRFAGDHAPPFVGLTDLVFRIAPATYDVIVVDEAAQVPVPLLQRLVRRHPDASIVFATTEHGYEGTGRGFSLRFLAWLRDHPQNHHAGRRLSELSLQAPIRWGADDPLEAAVFDALLLDADLALPAPGPYKTVKLDRDALVDAREDETLRGLFGLLVQAHYRTTPADLQHLLDGPNVAVHAVRAPTGHVVAASLVAEEGPLDDNQIADVYSGALRLRGHALPDSLVAHMGYRDAGPLAMTRSVRIAVHPLLRRQGLGSLLVEHVHESYRPDLFGTLFGATAGVVRFRRQLGYEVVRISASRGSRTGEPSVLMLRPESARAHRLVQALRADFARDLPLQLELLTADLDMLLDPALEEALFEGLPVPTPMDDASARAGAEAYAYGPRTFEACATAVRRFVRRHEDRLDALESAPAKVLRTRVLGKRSWAQTLRLAEVPSHRAAMRALRRGVRQLLELTAG